MLSLLMLFNTVLNTNKKISLINSISVNLGDYFCHYKCTNNVADGHHSNAYFRAMNEFQFQDGDYLDYQLHNHFPKGLSSKQEENTKKNLMQELPLELLILYFIPTSKT